MSKTYVDTNGYLRYSDSNKLVHRYVALKKLYNKDKYPLKFGEYQVHHVDRNKLNNDSSNLIICTRSQHEEFHGIVNPDGFWLRLLKDIFRGLIRRRLI